jgi:hypothetical protein
VKNDLQTKEVIKEKYDRILTAEELQESIKKTGSKRPSG